MYYLVNPNRIETDKIFVVHSSESLNSLPNQVQCAGQHEWMAGKHFTGHSKKVSCLEHGASDISMEIWTDNLTLWQSM